MNCDNAIELLPWLLNGTLEEGERREVEAHLASCEACRRALDETRFAWRVSDSHPPAQALTALAFGDPMPPMPDGLDPGLVERHVETCPRCAADLEIARLSRRLEREDNVAIMAPAATRRTRGGAFWRSAAAAATFACLVAAGGWVMSFQQARSLEDRLAAARGTAPVEAPAVDPGSAELERRLRETEAALDAARAEGARAAELEAEVERLKNEVATKPAAPATLQARINHRFFELQPEEEVRGEDDGNVVERPAGDELVKFLLAPEGDPTHVELVDADGRVLWQALGLVEQPEPIGGYTVDIPSSLLPRGRGAFRTYRLERGQRVGVEVLPFGVR